MKLIRARYRNQTNKKIRKNQPSYIFICPLKDVEVGEYVLVEHLPEGKVTKFAIAHVDEIFEMSINEIMKSNIRPRFFVVAKIDIKDLDKRTDQVKKMKYTLFSLYDGTYKKSGKQPKMPRMPKDDIRKAQVNKSLALLHEKKKRNNIKQGQK